MPAWEDALFGALRLQAIPAAARLRVRKREPHPSSTAADEKALSVFSRFQACLERPEVAPKREEKQSEGTGEAHIHRTC